MNTENIKKLKQLIIKKFNLDPDINEFDTGREFAEYGIGLDSVSNLELILEIEKALGINIDESQISGDILYNFNSLINYLDKCQ